MSQRIRSRHHHKRTFTGQLLHDIKKLFRRSGIAGSRISRDKTPEGIGASSFETGGASGTPPVPSSGKVRRKKKPKHKNTNPFVRLFDKLNKRLVKSEHERKKAKYKKRAKRKYRSEARKERWNEFKKKFIPAFISSSATSSHQHDSESGQKYPVKHYLYYAVNSTVLYMIAYLLVYMTYQITVLVMASFWNLDSVLFYYDLAFNDFSPLWNRLNIIIITISGPVISLIIGLVFLNYFVKQVASTTTLKLFFLWIAFHGFNLFLGAFATGVSFDEGFGYVSSWLFLNVFWKIFISLIFLFAFGLIGYYSAGRFLETSNSVFRTRAENRQRFLLSQAVIPWLAGGLIILLIRLPIIMPYDTANLITMFFGVIPIVFNMRAKPTIFPERKKRRQTNINWGLTLIFVVLFLAYRLGLNSGLHIILKMRFYIDISPV